MEIALSDGSVLSISNETAQDRGVAPFHARVRWIRATAKVIHKYNHEFPDKALRNRDKMKIWAITLKWAFNPFSRGYSYPVKKVNPKG